MEYHENTERNRFCHALGMNLDIAITETLKYGMAALSVVTSGVAITDPTPLHAIYALSSIMGAVHLHEASQQAKEDFAEVKNELGKVLLKAAQASDDNALRTLLVNESTNTQDIVDQLKERAPDVFKAIKHEPWSTHECVLDIAREVTMYGKPSFQEKLDMLLSGESLVNYRARQRLQEQGMSC